MRRTLTKQVLIGVGFPVLLADLGFAASGYSDWVAKHPRLLWIVGVSSVITILVGLFLPRKREQDPPQPALSNNNKQETGDVAGGSASAIGNHVTVNVNNPVPGLAEDDPQVLPKLSPVDGRNAVPKLRLQFVQPEVIQDKGVFRFARPGFRSDGVSLCIFVFNAPAAQGEYASDAREVVAVLTFTSATGKTTTVGRACWVGQEDNEISIPLGETAHILVGLADADEWQAFYNPNEPGKREKIRTNHRNLELPGPPKKAEKRSVDWFDGATFEVDVRIVSSNGQTLAHRQLLLSRNGIAFSAKWKDDQPTASAKV